MANPENTTASKIADEHHKIDEDIERLRKALTMRPSAGGFPQWRLDLVWKLRDFKNLLLKHFDMEEEGGFMRDVVRKAPQLERQVHELRDEHGAISTDLEQITETLKRMPSEKPDVLDRIRSRMDEVFTTIRRHEDTEHRLMQRAYFRDYGGRD